MYFVLTSLQNCSVFIFKRLLFHVLLASCCWGMELGVRYTRRASKDTTQNGHDPTIN